MSKRNGRNKIRLQKLDEINKIDKRMKKKKGSKPFIKVLGKVAEYVIPMLLPLLLGGKSTGRRSFKKWPPKGGKGD